MALFSNLIVDPPADEPTIAPAPPPSMSTTKTNSHVDSRPAGITAPPSVHYPRHWRGRQIAIASRCAARDRLSRPAAYIPSWHARDVIYPHLLSRCRPRARAPLPNPKTGGAGVQRTRQGLSRTLVFPKVRLSRGRHVRHLTLRQRAARSPSSAKAAPAIDRCALHRLLDRPTSGGLPPLGRISNLSLRLLQPHRSASRIISRTLIVHSSARPPRRDHRGVPINYGTSAQRPLRKAANC